MADDKLQEWVAKFAQQLAEQAMEDFENQCHDVGVESPIEKMMAAALIFALQYSGHYGGHGGQNEVFYHEKTKEQAKRDKARDRYFQSLGLIVLRYTGSEIYKNPLKCALDALSIIENRANSISKARGR